MIRKRIGTEVRQSNLKIKRYLPVVFFNLFFLDGFHVFASLYLEQDVVVQSDGQGHRLGQSHHLVLDQHPEVIGLRATLEVHGLADAEVTCGRSSETSIRKPEEV